MKIFLGFDDTDVLDGPMGTGRLVRMFNAKLPPDVRPWGVVRHQLLVDDRIPYTSHNSPACAVVEADSPAVIPKLIELATAHIAELASPGSDPGLCVASEDADLSEVVAFGLACTRTVCTQDAAKRVTAAANIHLSGHGGTHDGIIGATAAVGLTAYGWSGRLLEYGAGLRTQPDPITVAQLMAQDILVVCLDHNATVPFPDTAIHTNGRLRPRLLGGRPVVAITEEEGRWVAVGKKARESEATE